MTCRSDRDPNQVAQLMSQMPRADRAAFWREHIASMRRNLAENGMPVTAIDVAVAEHFCQVRAAHAAAEKLEARRSRYAVQFDEPPAVGTIVAIDCKRAVVTAVEPITRMRDGAPSWVIHWEIEGRAATSGMRSAAVTWSRDDVGNDQD